jgi:hypothetical protein
MDFIKSIYEDLMKIPEVKIIIETLEFSSFFLDIIFDFERKNVEDILITSRDKSIGLCKYKEGRIFIGAKTERFELLGIIAHEFTHQAMYIVFENDCKPYNKEQEFIKTKMEEVIETLKDQEDIDPIIRRVFMDYEKLDWPSEIITRIPHILAKYGNVEGKKYLLTSSAKLLYDFYLNDIRPSCKTFCLNARTRIKTGVSHTGVSLETLFKCTPEADELEGKKDDQGAKAHAPKPVLFSLSGTPLLSNQRTLEKIIIELSEKTAEFEDVVRGASDLHPMMLERMPVLKEAIRGLEAEKSLILKANTDSYSGPI